MDNDHHLWRRGQDYLLLGAMMVSGSVFVGAWLDIHHL